MKTWVKKIDPALVIAFFISVFLWVNFSLSEEHIKKTDLKINLIIPKEKSTLRTFPSEVKVSYRNRGFDLIGFKFRDSLEILLEDTDEQYIRADRIITEISQQFKIPRENISGIDLSDQLVQLELVSTKKLPLKTSDVEYELALGLIEVDSLQIEPDSITVSGPTSLLEGSEDWDLFQTSLGSITEPLSVSIPIHIPYRTVQVQPKTARISLNVEKYTEKIVEVPIKLKLGRNSFKIFPNYLEVRFLVGLSHYDQITEKDFKAKLNIEDIKYSKHEVVLTEYPQGIQLLQQTPDSASIFIYEENE